MIIADMHNDFLTLCPNPAEYRESLPPDAIVTAAIWTTQTCADSLDVERYALTVKESPQILIAVEDCGCFEPSEWDVLTRIRPVYAGLTWNGVNRYAGGAYTGGGLTDEGAELCRYLGGHGIKIDTAHLSDEAFDAVYDLGVDIIDSHTALSECYLHPRSVSLERASKVLDRGGMVGLTLVRSFFGGGLDAWVRQVDTFVEHFGAKHLGIGTDFWGSDAFVLDNCTQHYENLSELVEILRNMGYNEEVVRDIFARNYLSCWSEQTCTNTNFMRTPSILDTPLPK